MRKRHFDTIEQAMHSRICIAHGCYAKVGSQIVSNQNLGNTGIGWLHYSPIKYGAICENCSKDSLNWTPVGKTTIPRR